MGGKGWGGRDGWEGDEQKSRGRWVKRRGWWLLGRRVGRGLPSRFLLPANERRHSELPSPSLPSLSLLPQQSLLRLLCARYHESKSSPDLGKSTKTTCLLILPFSLKKVLLDATSKGKCRAETIQRYRRMPWTRDTFNRKKTSSSVFFFKKWQIFLQRGFQMSLLSCEAPLRWWREALSAAHSHPAAAPHKYRQWTLLQEYPPLPPSAKSAHRAESARANHGAAASGREPPSANSEEGSTPTWRAGEFRPFIINYSI